MPTLDIETWKLVGKLASGLVIALAAISGIIIGWRRLRREEKKEESRVYRPTAGEVGRYGRGKVEGESRELPWHVHTLGLVAIAALFWLLFHLFRWLLG